MELRQLKYFIAACELQNFSEAARQLFISQSTLSQQIKQLEDELDILRSSIESESGLFLQKPAVRFFLLPGKPFKMPKTDDRLYAI